MATLVLFIDDLACAAKIASDPGKVLEISSIVALSDSRDYAITFPIGPVADTLGNFAVKGNGIDAFEQIGKTEFLQSDCKLWGLREVLEDLEGRTVGPYLAALVKTSLENNRRTDWVSELVLIVPFVDFLEGEEPRVTAFSQKAAFELAAHDLGKIMGIGIQVVDAMVAAIEWMKKERPLSGAYHCGLFLWRTGTSVFFDFFEGANNSFLNQRNLLITNLTDVQHKAVSTNMNNTKTYCCVGFFGYLSNNADRIVERKKWFASLNKRLLSERFLGVNFMTESHNCVVDKKGLFGWNSTSGNAVDQSDFAVDSLETSRGKNRSDSDSNNGPWNFASPTIRVNSPNDSGSNLKFNLSLKNDLITVKAELPLDRFDNDEDYLFEVPKQIDGSLRILVRARGRLSSVALSENVEAFPKLHPQADGSYELTLDQEHADRVRRRRLLLSLVKSGIFHFGGSDPE